MDKHFSWKGRCTNEACRHPQKFEVPGLIEGARALVKCDSCGATYWVVVDEGRKFRLLRLQELPAMFGPPSTPVRN